MSPENRARCLFTLASDPASPGGQGKRTRSGVRMAADESASGNRSVAPANGVNVEMSSHLHSVCARLIRSGSASTRTVAGLVPSGLGDKRHGSPRVFAFKSRRGLPQRARIRIFESVQHVILESVLLHACGLLTSVAFSTSQALFFRARKSPFQWIFIQWIRRELIFVCRPLMSTVRIGLESLGSLFQLNKVRNENAAVVFY